MKVGGMKKVVFNRTEFYLRSDNQNGGMKVGDRLYCYSSVINNINGYNNINCDFTIGNVYTIFNINGSTLTQNKYDDNFECIWLLNDNGFYEWFSIIEGHIWYIGINFRTVSEMRRMKLNRLKNVDTL